MAFTDDIQSRDTVLFPIIEFDIFTEDKLRVSTQAFTLENNYYNPLLLSSPSIKESLDLENRNYKISTVSLSISNVEVNGARFSDNLIPYNTGVSIYWVSPSCTTINQEDNNACYLAYNGVVRDISHDEKTCSITLEDISQTTLHSDVPVNVLEGDNIIDKYKNKPYPMVYGYVDKSPCVIGELTFNNNSDYSEDEGSIASSLIDIITDYNEDVGTLDLREDNPLNLYSDTYLNVVSYYDERIAQELGYDNPSSQYVLVDNKIILVTTVAGLNTQIEGLIEGTVPSNAIANSEIIVSNRLNPIQFSSARLDWSINPNNQLHITSLSEVEELDNGLVKISGTVLKENADNEWDGESAIENGDDIWWVREDDTLFPNHEEIRTGCLVKVPTQGSGEAECGILSIDASVDILNPQTFESIYTESLNFQFRFGSSFNGDTDGDIGVKDFNITLQNQTDYINAFNINTMNDMQNSPLISDVHELLVYVELHNASIPNKGICEANININDLELLHYIKFKDFLGQDYYINNVGGRKSE
tara:strand:+ start:2579 stop:4174 length:1596 start_codon:yes stop_codon:yes gene_type:complete